MRHFWPQSFAETRNDVVNQRKNHEDLPRNLLMGKYPYFFNESSWLYAMCLERFMVNQHISPTFLGFFVEVYQEKFYQFWQVSLILTGSIHCFYNRVAWVCIKDMICDIKALTSDVTWCHAIAALLVRVCNLGNTFFFW